MGGLGRASVGLPDRVLLIGLTIRMSAAIGSLGTCVAAKAANALPFVGRASCVVKKAVEYG